MGFNRGSVRDDRKRENMVTLELSGNPEDIFSEVFIDFARHACIGLMAKEAQAGNDPDHLFELLEEHIFDPARRSAQALCERMLMKLLQDPARAREVCEHYARTGEIMDGVEL